MAAGTINPNVAPADGSTDLVAWTLTTADPNGDWIELGNLKEINWQAQDTWGGATLALQGSNDGTNAFPLTNLANTAAATLTANGGVSTREQPRYVRPALTVIGAGANVVVTALRRK